MPTINVTEDDVRLLEHTLHRVTAEGGGPLYLKALADFVARVRKAVSEEARR